MRRVSPFDAGAYYYYYGGPGAAARRATSLDGLTNLFSGPRDAEADDTGADRSGVTVTANAVSGPDGAALADQLAYAAGANYFYKAASNVASGVALTGSVWVRADAPVDIVLRGVNADFTTPSDVLSVTTIWQRFELEIPAGSIVGAVQLGLDNRASVGGDEAGKTIFTDFWQLSPS